MRKNRRRRKTAARIARAAAIGTLALSAAGVLAVSVSRAIRWTASHPYFAVREVRITGARALDRATILAWGGIEPGRSLWRVDAFEVERSLARHPRVHSTRVVREFPNRLAISVVEREPVAILLGRAGALYVDREGQFFPTLGADALEGFPYISGIRMNDLVERPYRVAARLRQAVEVIRSWERRPEWPPLSEVRPEATGEVVAYPERTAMTIRFGSGIEEEQFSRLSAVLDLWRGREAEVAAIDLSVPGQAVVRLRGPGGRRPARTRGDLIT